VRLVVLNYNGGDFVVRCLEALTKLDWPADRLELVVVDNRSGDGSDRVLEERFPEVRLVRNSANTGFPANNLGMRDLAGVDYVGLVNSDAFLEPDWLHPMVAALEADPEVGAASARMLFADRFVEIAVASPTFVPGVADSRELGVMVSGVRVGGGDRWRNAQIADGGWGLEHGRDGLFQWTRGHAVVRVPAAAGASTGSAGSGSGASAEVRLAAESAKTVTLTCGSWSQAVEVGTEPEWFPVELATAPIDVVNNVGSVVLTDGSGADRGYLEVDRGQYDEPADVFAWCGGSVLFRPAYLDDVGLFDERFFLYYEDTDLSWRGQGRGWRYRYVPGAVTRHIHAASTGEGSPIFQHYVERNRLFMLVKNAPRAMAWPAVVRYVLVTASYARRDIVRPVLKARRPNPTQVLRRVKSFLGFLRVLPGALAARRRIRRAATVPDEILLSRLTPVPTPPTASPQSASPPPDVASTSTLPGEARKSDDQGGPEEGSS
jgi:GT2 family glycosyltransferase